MITTNPTYKLFGNKETSLHQGLSELYAAGYSPLNMFQLIDVILDNAAPEIPDLSKKTIITIDPRISATHETGERIMIYSHMPGYTSHPENLQKSAANAINGAGPCPMDEVYRLLKFRNTDAVRILQGEELHAPSGKMSLDEAFKHPHAKAIIGPRIGAYLEWYRQNWGPEIEIYYQFDDTTSHIESNINVNAYLRPLSMHLHTPQHNWGSFGGSHIGKGGTFLGKLNDQN